MLMGYTKKAFTLVELLIVISVFSLLFVLIWMFIPIQVAKARDAVRKVDIDKLTKYIEDYYTDTNCYPVSIPLCGNSFTLNDRTYISDIPCDPITKNSYVYVSEISDCPRWFQLYGNLEYTEDKIIDDLGCRNGCGPDCQFNYGASSTNVRLNYLCKESLEVEPSKSPELSPIITPPAAHLMYACAPGGSCEIFAQPEESGCPDVYLDDPTCQDQCGDHINRCHDARGKTN